jgi:hypothetical protein
MPAVGTPGAAKEAEVVAAFAEINEDLKDKNDVVEKCM